MSYSRHLHCQWPGGRNISRPVRVAVNRLELDVPQPSRMERLLASLLARAFKTFPESHFKRPLIRAAREAERMAERTGFALLLLPELFAEMAIAEMLKAEYLRMGRI